MHLNSYSVSGFRSLQNVCDIPVSKPTILAGHNDGGKSALLDALGFLVGARSLVEADRSFLASFGPDEGGVRERCRETFVIGKFTLDDWEQQEFDLPRQVRLRRHVNADSAASLQVWGPLPDDDRLADLTQYQLAGLKELAVELGIKPNAPRANKPDYEKCLRDYGLKHSSGDGWASAPPALQRRMPRVLVFDGKAARPDDAVKTALMGKFQAHMADPGLQGKMQVVEDEVKGRLRIDAKSLCDHIRERCPDLTEVFVEPEISFQHGFRGAPLHIARVSGEAVGLDRSGLGSKIGRAHV